MVVSTVGSVSAASSRVEYNKAGISLFGENKVLTGESYKAPNGQDVPSVITYVDETGGKTNYLSIRQISELLDASVGWNAATNSVDIAAPNAGKIGEDVIVGSGKAAERENVLKPEYGKIVGGIEEIYPSAAAAIINNPDHRTRNFARNMKVQFLDSDFPGLTMNCLPYAGPYVVFAVTNNGPRTVYSEVRRFVTISSGCLTSAMAASGEVTYNFANVTLNGEKKISAGSDITVANGEKAPSSILYTDVAGGKTNYLPIRAISELLGISIDYDSATRTVLLDSQDEGDWVADGYNGYVVDPNGEKTEVPHLSD